VEASYIAWVFSESPSEEIMETVLNVLDLSKRTAIYNLKPFLKGKNEAFKLNFTNSSVFKKFEDFLEEGLNVNLEPFYILEPIPGEHLVPKLA